MRPSLLLGRIGGTEIRLHWTMLLILPYVYLAYRPQTLAEGLRALLWIGLVFLSVLLHELGHLAAARLYKLRVSSVVLWLLGGAAVTEHEADDPGAQLLIAIAGPLANFLIAALGLIGLVLSGAFSLVFGGGLPDLLDSGWLSGLIFIVATNLILALSNLLPIYPLDGGRIFRAVLHMFTGPARSAQITFWLSVLLALGVAIWAVLDRSWLLFGTALLLLGGTLTLNQELIWAGARVYARWFKRADLYIRLADFDPAIQILTDKINQEPHNPDLYLQRAYAYYFLEDFFKARKDAERTLAASPDFLPAVLLSGSVAYGMGLTAESWEMVARAEKIRPGWSMNYLNRAILLREAGRLPEALADVNQALEKVHAEHGGFTSPVLVHLLHSMLLWDMGDAERARMAWESALRHNPREAAAFSPDRARIFAKNWQWAEAYFAWLEQRGVDRALLIVTRGEVALRAGQYERAAADFAEIQRYQPALRDLCYYHGVASLELGRLAEAAADFKRAQQVSIRGHIRRLAAARLKQLETNGLIS